MSISKVVIDQYRDSEIPPGHAPNIGTCGSMHSISGSRTLLDLVSNKQTSNPIKLLLTYFCKGFGLLEKVHEILLSQPVYSKMYVYCTIRPGVWHGTGWTNFGSRSVVVWHTIGWLKMSAEFNIRPGPFYSSKKGILRGWIFFLIFCVRPHPLSLWRVTAEPFEMVTLTVYQHLFLK